MNYWLVRASLRPNLHARLAATIAVPSIDLRGLVVFLAACVPTFLAFWLVYRHGILKILAAFGSRHQSCRSIGGFFGRSQSSYRGGTVWNGAVFQAFCGTERRPSKMNYFVIKKTMAFAWCPPPPSAML